MDMEAQVKEKDRLSLFNLARRGLWLMRIRHMGVMRISPVVPICECPDGRSLNSSLTRSAAGDQRCNTDHRRTAKLVSPRSWAFHRLRD